MASLWQGLRYWRRLRQIIRVINKHGFGSMLVPLGLTPFVGLGRARQPLASLLSGHQAEEARLAVEELGATFIKLGQIASTRADLLPPALVSELEKLQDTVPSTPFPAIRAEVERELGQRLDSVFATFEPQPLASASLGQVHAATLPTGEAVAVKVLRPGIGELVERDLAIVQWLAQLAQERTNWGGYYDVADLAAEFADTLRAEQDYEREGRHIDLFRQNFRGIRYARVPKVYWDYSTRRVLTLERLEGIKITDLAGLDAAGRNRRRLARRNIRILLKAVLEDGFFHADPHAGNFFVLDNEAIGFMDFGIMGYLEPDDQRSLLHIFVGLFRGETARVVNGLLAAGIAGSKVDRRRLSRELDRLRMNYFGRPLEEIGARAFLEDLLAVAFRNRLRMPTNLVLVFKTIAMMEGLSLQLDPTINLFTELEPQVRQALNRLEGPQVQVREMAGELRDSSLAMLIIPQHVQALIEQVYDGQMKVTARLSGMDHAAHEVSAAANRLALAVVIAAFVLGPALLLPNLDRLVAPTWRSAATILIVGGFALSFTFSIFLLISIWRSGGTGGQEGEHP